MNTRDRITLEDIEKPDECAWITARFTRRLSLAPTRWLLRLHCSANAVTLAAGLAWLFSLPMTVLAGFALQSGNGARGWFWLGSAALLWFLGHLFDLVDGNIARITQTESAAGFYFDYVFHLLTKPAFLCAIGMMLFLVHESPLILLLAILSIPANWNPSDCAVEHVIAQHGAKRKHALDAMPEPDRTRLLLGVTDIQSGVETKQRSRRTTLRVALQEIISYYGQFSLFALLVVIDGILWSVGVRNLFALHAGFIGISLLMIARTPFRIRREFRRAAILDRPPERP